LDGILMGYFLFGMAKLTAKKEEHGENNKNVTIIAGILVLILFNVMRQTGDLRLHQWIWQRLDIISEWRYVGGEADHFFKMGRGQTVPLLQALKKHEEDAFRNILNA
jgi:hypothetical protein